MPSATPTTPTADIFAQTIGSTNQPGELKILNGKLVFSSGASETAYDILIDGLNKRIIINDGTNDRVLIGYYSGLF